MTFPAAVVTILHASLREPILKLIEATTGLSGALCVLLTLVGRVEADCFAPGDIFAGRRVCFHSTIMGSADNVPALQKLGDCCRRLRGSHSVDVQVSLCMQCKNHSECCDAKVAEAVKCLVPHLCGMSMQPSFPFRLQPLLPAAPQLERLEAIVTDSETFSLLGQFPMLKDLYVHVRHSIQLTAPLPQLHTLRLLSWRVPLRQDTLQCLVSHATALRRLVLGCKSKSHSG